MKIHENFKCHYCHLTFLVDEEITYDNNVVEKTCDNGHKNIIRFVQEVKE